MNRMKDWEANTQDLYDKFPVTMRNVYCSARYGKGWHPVIMELTAKIEAYNADKSGDDVIECHQIKEKFGGLRYYVSWGSEEVERWITEAERKTRDMCEFCGAVPVRATKSGWVKRLCEPHAVEWEAR